jgi:methyl-accepting chemotaxis protein
MKPRAPGGRRQRMAQIAPRLLSGFGLLILLMVAVAVFGGWQIRSTAALVDRLVQRDVALGTQLSDWRNMSEMAVLRTVMRSQIMMGDAGPRLKEENAKAKLELQALQASIGALIDTPALRAPFDQSNVLRKQLDALELKIDEMEKLGDFPGMEELLKTHYEPLRQAYLKEIQTLSDLGQAAAEQAVADARDRVRRTLWITAVAVALAVLLSSTGGWWLSQSIARPIRQSVTSAQFISQGDLSVPVEVGAAGEAGELQEALSQMQQSLQQTVEAVAQAASTISIISTEFSTGSSDLSVRTEQTAANLQAAAANVSRLAVTSADNTAAAARGEQLARQASESAGRGELVIGRVVATMQEINQATGRIAEINTLIESIAFQTNLLALNAAVEAAHAGELGRGFAMVAGEVGKLSKRSDSAAKEIKGLIQACTEQVGKGQALVRDAKEAMQEILKGVARVSEIVNGIAQSLAAQDREIGGIHGSVKVLDDMTQQNSALVQQTAAAAENLRAEAGSLVSTVALFKLKA